MKKVRDGYQDPIQLEILISSTYIRLIALENLLISKGLATDAEINKEIEKTNAEYLKLYKSMLGEFPGLSELSSPPNQNPVKDPLPSFIPPKANKPDKNSN